MAFITLQDWSCIDNSCRSPFKLGNNSPITADTPQRLKNKYPDARQTAVAYMRELGLSAVKTEHSYLRSNETATIHVQRMFIDIETTREAAHNSTRTSSTAGNGDIRIGFTVGRGNSTLIQMEKAKFVRWMDSERQVINVNERDKIAEREKMEGYHLYFFNAAGKTVVEATE